MKGLVSLAMVVSGLAVIAGIAGSAGAQPSSPSQPAKKDPAHFWASTCGYCHGGPMNAPELRGLNLPTDFVVEAVRQGRPGMPPFHRSEVSDADLRSLARWISKQPAPQPGPEARR